MKLLLRILLSFSLLFYHSIAFSQAGSAIRIYSKYRGDLCDSCYQVFMDETLATRCVTVTNPTSIGGLISDDLIIFNDCDTIGVRSRSMNDFVGLPNWGFAYPDTAIVKPLNRICNGFSDRCLTNIPPFVVQNYRFIYSDTLHMQDPCSVWHISSYGNSNRLAGTGGLLLAQANDTFFNNPNLIAKYVTNLPFLGSKLPCNFCVDSIAILSKFPNYSSTSIAFPTSNMNGLIDNLNAPKNSNPYEVNGTPMFFYRNFRNHWNFGYVDPDGHKLKFKFTMPKANEFVRPVSPSPSYYNGSNVYQYIPAQFRTNHPGTQPPYNMLTNPIDCNNTFELNDSTGDFSFIPSELAGYALNLTIEEYDTSGAKVAETSRYFMFRTEDPVHGLTYSHIDTASITNAYLNTDGTVIACAGKPMHFDFKIKHSDPLTPILVKDSIDAMIPGASINYSGITTNQVTGSLNWTPTIADTGLNYFTVQAWDSTCGNWGFFPTQIYTYAIYVNPSVVTNEDTLICQGASVQLHAFGGANFSWLALNGGAGSSSLSCTNCANPIATPNKTTTYVVTSNIGGSCYNTDTVTITVAQNFTLKATDTLICGQAIQLQLKAQTSNTGGPLTYQWSPATGIIGSTNTQNIIITPNTTQYIVTVSDTAGCFTHSDTSTVVYDPTFSPTLTVSPIGSICTGDTVNLTITNGGTTTWSPNYNITNLTGNSTNVFPDTAMSYTALIQSANSICKSSITQEINVIALRADAGPDQEIFDGEAVYLGGPNMLCGNGCNLQWYPDEFLFFSYYKNPKAVPHVTTTYWVMVRNDASTCIDRDSVTIKVKCDDIYMPNAFYPENNATSDYTRLFGPRNVSIDLKYFRIFNRWGQQVFQTNNIRDRWDGTFKGVAQPSGNYVWIIEGNCPNGEAIHKTGNVFLAR